MKATKWTVTLGLVAGLFILGSNASHADDGRDDHVFEILELSNKLDQMISLREAIDIATSEQNGLVERAHVEFANNELSFNIEISDGSRIYRYEIDARSGEITSQSMDIGETLFHFLALGLISNDTAIQQRLMENLRNGMSGIDGGIVSLKLEQEDERPYFEIMSLSKEHLSVILVSGHTGDVVFFRNYKHTKGESGISIKEIFKNAG